MMPSGRFVRTVRDKQFRYIRNYRPDLPWGQHVQYMFQQRGYRAWERLRKAGKLNPVQDRFWHEKPEEELYDLSVDPDEVNNLASAPDQAATMQRMRARIRGSQNFAIWSAVAAAGSPACANSRAIWLAM